MCGAGRYLREKTMRKLIRLPAIAAAALAALAVARAEDVRVPRDVVLSENDIGAAGDMTQAGRWGDLQTEGEVSCRAFRGPRSLSRVGMNAWWDGDAPGENVMLVVTFKDTTPQAVTVGGWTGAGGIYGYPVIGRIGGANDGRWKKGLLICPKTQIKRHPGGEWEGKWSLIFNGGGTILVDRIQVAKVTDDLKTASIRAARASRAASIEALKKQYKRVPWKETVELGDVSAEHKRLGFVPYARPYTIDVYPGSVPKASERGAKTLAAYATPGEFEPVQVAAYALKDLKLAVSVTDLRGPGVLKADEEVEVFWIESTAVRPKSSWGKEWQTRPVWLRPARPGGGLPYPVPVKSGTSLSWFLRVHVPEEAKAGVYRGSFKLEAEGGRSARFPIEVRVLPFKLDKVTDYAWGPYVSSPLDDEYIQDLADHGMNSMSLFAPGGLRPKMRGGRCVLDLSPAMEEYLGKLKKLGFVRLIDFGGGDPWYNNPSNLVNVTKAKVGTPQFEKYYAQYWQDIKRLEKEKGWPEIICCPFDEPVKSEAKVRNYITCYEIIKKVLPETKVFCVFMNRTSSAKRLGRKSDIWSCNGAFGVNQAEKLRLAKEGTKKLFYTYTGCMGGYRPGAARYNAGVVPWHYDADGTYFWAYKWTGGDPFNDLDAGHRDWSPIARDVDGRLYTCTCWEGYREGVDDRRYIETCLRIAKEKNRRDILDKIAGIKAGIRPGRESTESTRTKGLDDFFIKLDNASELDVIRAEVTGMILEMKGVKR